MAKKVVRDFAPDIAVGVGGYASGPTLYMAHRSGIPTVLQEQNSYAGVTNKLLAKKAEKICVAYEGMERFFPQDKIILTGNPVRQDFLEVAPKAQEAYDFFHFSPEKKTLLIIGGSLGARTINQSVIAGLSKLKEAGIQVLWQTGKLYYEGALKAYEPFKTDDIVVTDFVKRMDFAYSIADLVVSRAGASSISELCLLGKPSILVPSPNVAEDHQTKNAQALASRKAAVMVADKDANSVLLDEAIRMIGDEPLLNELGENAKKMAQLDSADRIADEILKLIEK
jgi:UDP-N-acetylglucosamine--N-acetylmuramyl-(pentapeptide) pyrophosphoryl-undecaprenol N-acetylglucosamine transferase